MDKTLMFAFGLVLTLFYNYGDVSCLWDDEKIDIKRGLVDLRVSNLENKMQTVINDVTQFRNKANDLEKENAEFLKLLYLMADKTPAREIFEAYITGHCYLGWSTMGYSGKLSTTVHGKTCQRWDQQYPHEHTFTNVTTYPDNSLSDAENYCRDPSNTGYAWCYTTDPKVRWEPCDVTKCRTEFTPNYCLHFDEKSSDYKGYLNVTYDGHSCQRWSSQYPHDHQYTSSQFPEGNIEEAGNYCRDPGHWGLPWCYTTDPDTRWRVCGIARCFQQQQS